MSRRHVRWVEDAGRGSVPDDVDYYQDVPDARELAQDYADDMAREKARRDAHNTAAEAERRLNHPPARNWGTDNTEEF